MRPLPYLLLILLIGLFMAGCQTTHPKVDPTTFTEIRICLYPQGWGYAYKTVRPDGVIVGGHLSGGPEAPQLFENKSRLTPEDLAFLRQLAAKLSRKTQKPLPPPPDQHVKGHAEVMVAFADGHAISVIADWGKPFKPKTFQRIWDVVKPYAVGAW